MNDKLYPFYQSLKARRFSVTALASLVGSDRNVLYGAFAGTRRISDAMRRRLMVYLSNEELEILGWDPNQRPKLSVDIKFYVERAEGAL